MNYFGRIFGQWTWNHVDTCLGFAIPTFSIYSVYSFFKPKPVLELYSYMKNSTTDIEMVTVSIFNDGPGPMIISNLLFIEDGAKNELLELQNSKVAWVKKINPQSQYFKLDEGCKLPITVINRRSQEGDLLLRTVNDELREREIFVEITQKYYYLNTKTSLRLQ